MKSKTKLLIIICVIISASIGLISILNYMSFRKNHMESFARSNAVACIGVANKIEYAVKYGKPLSNFYGIQDIFNDAFSLSHINETYLADEKGKLLYSKVKDGTIIELPEEFTGVLKDFAKDDSTKFSTFLVKEDQHVILPVKDSSGSIIGYFGVVYDMDAVSRNMAQSVKELLLSMVSSIILGIGIFILIYIFYISKNEINKRRLWASTIIVLILANLFYAITVYGVFQKGYIEMTANNAEILTERIKADIDSVLSKGVVYSRFSGMEEYLKGIYRDIDEIESISLAAEDEAILSESEYVASAALKKDAEGVGMRLNIKISREYISGRLSDTLLDLATILIVSIMISIEIVLFVITLLMGTKKENNIEVKDVEKDIEVKDLEKDEAGIVRGVAFVVFTLLYMTVAFVPIVMTKLYRPIFNLPYDIVISLPISAEMLFSVIAAAFCGVLIDRGGWKPAAIAGLITLVLGNLASGITNDAVFFILSRCLCGIGMGLVLTAIRVYGYSMAKEGQEEKYIASVNSGAVTGCSAAVVVGAMIADRAGFSRSFMLVALLGILTLGIVYIFARNNKIVRASSTAAVKASWKELIRCVDGKFISFILFMIFPAYILAMFLNYYFPVFANDAGLSTSNIGRAFMLNGLCVVYVGSLLSGFIHKRLGNIKGMVLGIIIAAVAMIVFAQYGNIMAAFTVIIVMGITDGFTVPAQYSYMMKHPLALRIGQGKTISLFSIVSNISKSVAPLIFGIAVLKGGFTGIALIGAITAVLAIAFAIIGITGKSTGSITSERGA